MTMKELRCALAVEPGDSVLNEEGLPDRGYLLSVCGGLVMISGDTETVRFTHYTVQEYFERVRHPQFSSAHKYLANTCITYLSFSNFEAEPPIDYPFLIKYERFLDKHALLQYASVHWGDHVRECCDQEMARVLLTQKGNILCSIRVRDVALGYSYKPFLHSVSDLHVAATFGIDLLVNGLLQQGASVDVLDCLDRTPLHEAAAGGHIQVIRSLLKNGANTDPKDIDGKSAIELATMAGHEPATRLLLQDALLPDMQRVISGVVREGHLGVLRVILERLKDTPEKAIYVGNALYHASWHEREACLRLLLEEVEDLEMSELQSHLDQALRQSLDRDNPVMTKLLLDHGADPNAGLHRAAERCGIASVRHLLDHGANIEAVGTEGKRPIHLSCSLGFGDRLEGMLKLLLERRADINAYRSDKQTPLMIAAARGYADLVHYLLHNGADVLAKDGKFNRSAIEWGLLGGHLHVVQSLLKSQPSAETGKGLIALARFYQALRFLDTNKVESIATKDEEYSENKNSESEVDDESSDDLNPEPDFHEEYNRLLPGISSFPPGDLKRLLLLHHPVRWGDETAVLDFINMGANVEALNEEGKTALHIAAEYGHANILRLLLDHGAIVDPQRDSGSGFTPLLAAIRDGSYDNVQLLIQRGADVDRESTSHDSPLMWAIDCWEEDIVSLLLESGADPNFQTSFGQGGNALHNTVYAPSSFGPKISRLLVAKGANLEAKYHNGQTPLQVAVGLARLGMVSSLLELGADPFSVEDDTLPFGDGVDSETAMQLIKAAKQRRIEDTQARSPRPSIDKRGIKRKISSIL